MRSTDNYQSRNEEIKKKYSSSELKQKEKESKDWIQKL